MFLEAARRFRLLFVPLPLIYWQSEGRKELSAEHHYVSMMLDDVKCVFKGCFWSLRDVRRAIFLSVSIEVLSIL